MEIKVINGDLSPLEIDYYKSYALEREPNCIGLDIELDGEYVNLTYHIHHQFDRIRRITGYLVGTLDRFNNGKRAEESQRIKHTIESE